MFLAVFACAFSFTPNTRPVSLLVKLEDITKKLPSAARAVEFEPTGGGNKLVKKTKEHLEAEKNLRGKDGEELKIASRELTKQRRKYRARRIMQEMQKVKNKQAGSQALFCEKEETTSDRQKLGGGAEKILEEQVSG